MVTCIFTGTFNMFQKYACIKWILGPSIYAYLLEHEKCSKKYASSEIKVVPLKQSRRLLSTNEKPPFRSHDQLWTNRKAALEELRQL